MKKFLTISTILSLAFILPLQTGAFEMFDVSDKMNEIKDDIIPSDMPGTFVPNNTVVPVGGNPDPSHQEVNEAINNLSPTTQTKISNKKPSTTYFAGKGISLKNNKFFLNEGYSPTWTGNHTFNKNITVNNNNPSLILDSKSGQDYWLGSYKDEFSIGSGSKRGDNIAMILQGNGSVKMASNLNIKGGGIIKKDLDIRELGCLTPNEVRFENNTDLNGIEKGDIFYDAGNKAYKVTGKDQSYFALKIDGQCQAEGDGDIRVERSGMIVNEGNIGFGVTVPQDKLDIAGGDIKLSNKKQNTWIKVFAPEDSKAGIKLGTNKNNEDLAQWQIYTGGKNLRIQGWETSEMKDALVLTKDGRMGVGVSEPQADLDVDGFMKLTPQKEAPVECNKDTSGSIAMTKDYLLCTCNGEKWVHSYAGGSDCRWDKK
ncbi:hypothetical protein KKC88_06075 [Patescibacteria group bacterium]|nr:hypothetical protein [Patescibacteria group bacterium]MBU1673949.1 hypothetical protein [Patescibacteria group bacterium]MBU1963943.1 hypothetical protein [Patescibacteria group bacterium]